MMIIKLSRIMAIAFYDHHDDHKKFNNSVHHDDHKT